VDTCFANPGTSEMHFVAALDRVPGMHCVLGLFEGVVTGAADGYARMTGRPAATLLHCGPGLGNGLANLHNAQKARVPIVNIVGDHATYHRPLNPPLAQDTEAWARPVSNWVRTTMRPEWVGRDAAEGVQAARSTNGIATLILPSDASWGDGGIAAAPLPVSPAPHVEHAAIAGIKALLGKREPTLFVLADCALTAPALADMNRIAAATGARYLAETFNTRIERGRGRHPIARVPYVIDEALEFLRDVKYVVLVGAHDPVGFFAYPGKPSRMTPDAAVHVLARPGEDGADALARLADAIGAPAVAPPAAKGRTLPARGAVSPEAVGQTLTALMPENAAVVDESITFGFRFLPDTVDAAPHDWMQVKGGSIGGGMPLATGAAVGAPGRRVINLQADGSALYTVQSLWTQAREKLDVTTVIFSNRKYAILIDELRNVGVQNAGRTALDMFDLGSPDMDWIKIANGLGVEAGRAASMEQFGDLFAVANDRKGPFLIELVIG
jgi:acetolactate synthase-1/2/3 large subunit